MKTLLALAAAAAVLASTGCCWPFHEGHHRYGGWSDDDGPSHYQRDGRDRDGRDGYRR
jgi:hypothetical protein